MTGKKKGTSGNLSPATGEFVLYRTEDGATRVECRFAEGTIWLTQIMIAELFQTTVPNVNLHLKNIYNEGELDAGTTIKDYLIVRREGNRGVRRSLRHYNLEAILAIGYRVQSHRGTQFRQWATARLEEYLRKGFVLDDERLKNPPGPGAPDYFDELLERIRDIRASERRLYLRVREILSLAADYDPKDEETQLFFQTVQNKLHFAVTGRTAPEIIAERADHAKPNMGLTTWQGSVVRRGDVTIAKNYLNETEIAELNRIVVMFLDFAEDQAKRRKQTFLRDWRERLNAFLALNERGILPDAGRVSREDADRVAHERYVKFEERRRMQAEDESMKSLEKIARKLPRRKGPQL
ncbi:MAG: hydroxyacid dehydrogenase [Planctomycetes bacterium RBG_16_59_8]|nr:MAG: hydroxyacid dehydrogenase [Planctomycetes bacterium RBG_16_59_8]